MPSMDAVLSVTVKVMPVLSVLVEVHSCTDTPEMVVDHTPEGVENDESLDEIVMTDPYASVVVLSVQVEE